jgi:hypothetical protein
MRSFEVITPEANRPGSRLQPKRHGAASIQKDLVCIPGDPDVVVAKVNHFGFVGWGFKQSVHVFALGLNSSSNHKALSSAKLNQVRLDGELHNPSGFAYAADVVNARDELTKRQRLLLVIDLHSMRMGRETARALWGVYPICDVRESDVLCARQMRLNERLKVALHHCPDSFRKLFINRIILSRYRSEDTPIAETGPASWFLTLQFQSDHLDLYGGNTP